MATVSSPFKPVNRVEADQRVRHPLQKLRGYIRTYVALEGAAIALLFLALWFWIGLLLDYGSFRWFAFDWTYELSDSTGAGTANVLRGFILVVLLGALFALVAIKIFFRLFREFRDSALALVLERRFPKELGDRLITAVEMADPKIAQKYGFSQSMIDQTIREAAERVEKVPVRDVFNWGRLIFQGVLVVICTLVFYLVTLATVCLWEGQPVPHYFVRFNHTAGIWAERNLLLMGTYWPRTAQLEFVRLQTTRDGEVRVPRDFTTEDPRPEVLVRAVKYVIADARDHHHYPLGWRPLTYKDLHDRQLVSAATLDIGLPRDWGHWIVDLDDLPSNIPPGLIPAKWKWQGMSSGALRAELHKADQDIEQLQKDLVKAKKEIAQVRAANQKAGNDTVHASQLPSKLAKAILHSEKTGKPLAKEEFVKDRLAKVLVSNVGERVNLRAALTDLLDWHTWTLDKIELQLSEPTQKPALIDQHAAAYDQFHTLIQSVRDLAADPGMERTLRELAIPANVNVLARAIKSGGRISATKPKQQFNKYPVSLKDLTETSKLTVNAEDYYSPAKLVTLLAPPVLDLIVADKQEPAYLYYRFVKDANILKGKQQILRGVSVSKGGNESTINLAAGASVVIRASADRPLQDTVYITQPEKTDGALLHQVPKVHLLDDRKTFEAEIKNITHKTELDIVFRDEDNVKGVRRFLLVPLDDSPALVTDVALPPALRFDPKDRTRRVITPLALFPWKGKLFDDRSLIRAAWRFDYEEKDLESLTGEKQTEEPDNPVERRKQALGRVVANLTYTPGPSTYLFNEAVLLADITAKRVYAKGNGIREMANFQRKFRNPDNDPKITPEELQVLLQIHPHHRPLFVRLLEVNIGAPQLRDLAQRYQDVLGHEDKLQALESNLSPPQQSVKHILDQLQAGSLDNLQAKEKLRAFTSDLLAAIKVAPEQRKDFSDRVRGEYVKVFGELLALVNERPDEKDALGKALAKQPDRGTIKLHDLENEPDFDVGQFNLKVARKEEAQPHYELKIYLHARDSDVERTGPVPPDAGPFTFLIVSETELNDLMLVEKGVIQKLLKETIDKLETRKSGLDSEGLALKQQSRPNLKATADRLDQVLATVRSGGDIVRGILVKCKSLLEEMELNRFREARVKEEKDKIVNPLESICHKGRGELMSTDRFLDIFKTDLQKKLDKVGSDEGALWDEHIGKNLGTYQVLMSDASAQVEDLAKKLRAVYDSMKDLQSEVDLVAALEYIASQQAQNHLRLLQYQQNQRKKIWNELIK